MATAHRHPRIALVLLAMMTSEIGVGASEFGAQSPRSSARSQGESFRADLPRRWMRVAADDRRGRCAELTASWQENSQQRDPQDHSTVVRLRVRPLSAGVARGSVFPEKPLFSFVRRIYRCCQDGLDCRSVKGIQGRLRGSDVELLLTREILSLRIKRAELHLQLTNPQQADIRPVLLSMAKSNLPTRFLSRSHGNTVELRVDLLFYFQSLQEAAGGPGLGRLLVDMRKLTLSTPHKKLARLNIQPNGGDVWGGLGLAFGCSQAGFTVLCESSGVGLLHSPFVTLYYL
ncbi:uncharacterized protein si:ch211-170d8.2 [Syngnathoides biaculeatus]|uniref:uncharacterized protein si:ch211-170d8.2 n=1 Tax=Syngnathoides biaculeatus TaxID=300417 RepID=UPI002ADE8B72|nr:uncharacterized protein si:ch211-170d8.2 [Syngnathoides biaculeatus]